TAIELDVHATADGELVVSHDATVDRTTNGSGAIAAMTLRQLRALDNAYWFIPGADVTPDRPSGDYPYRGRAPAERDFGVATLREVLERFPGIVLNLDIKQTAPAVVSYEATLAALLDEYGRRDDVIVASFHDVALERFAAVAPHLPISAGTTETTEFWRAVHEGHGLPELAAAAFQVPDRMGDLVVVDALFVSAAHDAGIAVHVWTVNDAAAMHHLVDLGVDGIITDLPSTLQHVLATRGAGWQGLGATTA
ncbi:MAG: glycerophosphodiester phosphodiesterase, partial [Acidimicrobiales bacterium]